jgi:hypothetical protein
MIIKNGVTYKNRKEWRLARGYQKKDEGNKYCPECGLYRSIEEFKKLTSPSALKRNPDGYYWCCNRCYKEKTWIVSPNEPINREIRRRDKLLRRVVLVESLYGLNEQQYMDKIEEQHNLCAICGKKYEGKVLCVDHDHRTGIVRGLLCGNCNLGLGNFRDDSKILQSAIAYLQKYSKQTGPSENDVP